MFADKFYLFLLFLIPVFVIFFFYVFKKRKRDLFLFISRKNLSTLSNVNLKAYSVKFILSLTGMFLIILALARPQYGEKEIFMSREYSELIIALDISKSMLSEDIKPNRLEKAKMMLANVILASPQDKIGIIAFAGAAMWQCPMTFDHSALKMFLDSVSTGSLPLGGTQISGAITLASKAVENRDSKNKTLLLISDGEDQESEIKEALALAGKADLKIISVTIGTVAGAPIPVKGSNGVIKDYVKDKRGRVVMSRVNAVLLKNIAQETGGKYFEALDDKDVSSSLINAIKDLDKNSSALNGKNNKVDRFQIFLLIGLLFLLAEMLVSVSKKML